MKKLVGPEFVVCTAGGKILANNVADGLAAFDRLPEAERKPQDVLAEKREPTDPKRDPCNRRRGG